MKTNTTYIHTDFTEFGIDRINGLVDDTLKFAVALYIELIETLYYPRE
jgi:hypothetical protein